MKLHEVTGFVPERLIAAREFHGFSASDISKRLGVSRQSISAYENGKQRPSRSIFVELADLLNFPIDFFFRPLPHFYSKQVFFRSLTAATKKGRKRIERRIDFLIDDIVPFLQQYIEFLPVKLPEFGVKLTFAGAENIFEEVEGIAKKCRRHWELGDGPISNLIMLLENNGIVVVRQALEDATLDAFSIHNDVPVVVLSADKESAVRSRFDAAHELAHLVIHRSVMPSSENIRIIEKQAFRFASAFLLPAETFGKEFHSPTLDSFWALKRKWKVSIAAMIKRCSDLKIVNKDQEARLWRQFSARGWKKKEPLDDSIQIEQPVFLRRCLELLINEKLQSRTETLSSIPLASSDIEMLCNLPLGFLTREQGSEGITPRLRNPSAAKQEEDNATIIPFRPNTK